ncbi:MAG: hypothetical protein JRI58_13365 [Deltaproteobacteria bacterium]|nr:hypothetical protein [Deltaproteobacteria bacterium]MBW2075708.1 hypothetical protein [Deltaproteobacteria bacterium]RLB81588.1 MAG: hypothetical protein DRH17_08595 [Deltaproteobacteria bacterium]
MNQTKNVALSGAKKHLLAILLISIVATAIYSNSFDCSFHFDDQHAIVENYAIHRFDLKQIFSSSPRPILDLTLAINYYFGKLDVFGYHLVNLLLHISNGIMLYFILLWTASLPSMKEEYQDRSYRIAIYASLIFVAHPIQTQAVTYIISRSSVLATTFYLLTLLLFIQAFRAKGKGQSAEGQEQEIIRFKPLTLYLIGAFFASCLGMGSKQIAATLPLTLLIYDFYFISNGDWRALKDHYKVHLAMFSTISVAVYLSASGLQKFVSFDYAKGVPMLVGEPVTSWQYFLTQLHVIPYYIKLLFIPTNLNLDYDWPITRSIDLSTALFFILLAAIVVFAIWVYRRARLLSFGIIWFFVTLSVTSSFIVIYDVIFEHRLYLPSVGFALFMALIISRISQLRFGQMAGN